MKELYLKLRANLGLVTMWSFDGAVLVSNVLIDCTYLISALNWSDVIP